MRKLLAVVLLVLGAAGLAAGWLGSTVWAPDKSHTASASLSEPGAAVVIDPGVLYVGGDEGQMTVRGAGELTLLTASPGDVEAFLADTPYTAITGADSWESLRTEQRNSDGSATAEGFANSDIWTSTTRSSSPATINIADWASAEKNPSDPQPYRSLVIVADGKAPAASDVSVTWPSNDRNEWVPYAYASGAVLAVIGLVLLLLSFAVRRDTVADGDAVPTIDKNGDVEFEPVPADEDSSANSPQRGRRARTRAADALAADASDDGDTTTAANHEEETR